MNPTWKGLIGSAFVFIAGALTPRYWQIACFFALVGSTMISQLVDKAEAKA